MENQRNHGTCNEGTCMKQVEPWELEELMEPGNRRNKGNQEKTSAGGTGEPWEPRGNWKNHRNQHQGKPGTKRGRTNGNQEPREIREPGKTR